MKALIIEDEKMAQAQLIRLLNANFSDIEVVSITDSVRSTLTYLATAPDLDIIFMDVELSDGDCFEIFRQTPVRAKVIMTTAYDTYAIKAFEAGSVDYLLKPIDTAPLTRAVNRCRESSSGIDVQKLLSAIGGEKKRYKERIVVNFGEKIIPVRAEEIAYFYSEDKANYIVLNDGEKYMSDSTMDSLEGELDPEQFFRVSRGCIIGRWAVKSASRYINGRLKIHCKPEPPFDMTVARARVDDFYAWLE